MLLLPEEEKRRGGRPYPPLPAFVATVTLWLVLFFIITRDSAKMSITEDQRAAFVISKYQTKYWLES